MTRDEIVEIAWEVGILMRSHKSQDEPTKLERFAERIAAVEREACATLCNHVPGLSIDGAKRVAAAIRARGET